MNYAKLIPYDADIMCYRQLKRCIISPNGEDIKNKGCVVDLYILLYIKNVVYV